MKNLFVLVFSAFLVIPLAGSDRTADNSSHLAGLATSMQHKLQYLQTNARVPTPNPAPTEFTEEEINAYFASGNLKLPQGVHSVTLEGEQGIILGNAQVDFDQLKIGRNSFNPLLSVFSGVHEVTVGAHAHGAGGRGLVHIDSVALDGVVIPPFLLELFVQRYLQTRYPGVGLDSQFTLPERVNTATVGVHKLTVTQK